MWTVQEIRPLVQSDPQLAAIWSASSPQQVELDPALIPSTHYNSVIQISDDCDGRYLLNPLILPQPGEWQAAFFANWVPGARCYPSFKHLMSALRDAFIASQPPTSSTRPRQRTRNFLKPPDEPITDPLRFVAELKRFGFFKFVSAETEESTIREFYLVSDEFLKNGEQCLSGQFRSPGSVLFTPDSGRFVDLDVDLLAFERGRYATEMARLLFATFGIEIGPCEEMISPSSYSVRLDDITHEYFKLRKGNPALSGGAIESNIARYVLYQTAILLNKVLVRRGHAERACTLTEVQSFATERNPKLRMAFVVLDDDLSYLLTWTAAIHNYCRPMRPDWFR